MKRGLNKEQAPLEQINLALLFGEKSALPFYYRKLAGNIPDVKTVKNLLADLDVMGYQQVKLVMDRGFCSAENINALYQAHLSLLQNYFLAGDGTTKCAVKKIISYMWYFRLINLEFCNRLI